LLGIVVGTVLVVFAGSRWVDARLAERTLDHDIEGRALSALRTVDFFWGHTEPRLLTHVLDVLVRSNGPIVGIEVFAPAAGRLDPLLGTTPDHAPEPSAAALQLFSDAGTGRTVASDRSEHLWHVAMAVRRAGQLVGIAQATLSPDDVIVLHDRLRAIDLGALGLSVALTSMVLGLFVERRVTRPVRQLVGGMRRAEAGERGVQVSAGGSEEFIFLSDAFNRMLARLEHLAGDLEHRVQRATRDLADRNQQLADTNARLWRAQLDVVRGERFAALGQMAATIAHELGTPLNSVLGYTQLLRREDMPPAQAARLAIVESQVQRMIETIRSVLDRTRGAPARTPVALGAVVTETLALLESRLAERGLEASNDTAPDLPAVPGDPVALRQVLLNLLTNAIDATAPGGHIAVHAGWTDDGSIELSVRDTGVGLAPEDVRRIFEPFYTTKSPERGSGLGLAIVDHVTRAHGGRVLVESLPGRGTTMRVILPLETQRKAHS
jgi:signal transduction histidine kinase